MTNFREHGVSTETSFAGISAGTMRTNLSSVVFAGRNLEGVQSFTFTFVGRKVKSRYNWPCYIEFWLYHTSDWDKLRYISRTGGLRGHGRVPTCQGLYHMRQCCGSHIYCLLATDEVTGPLNSWTRNSTQFTPIGGDINATPAQYDIIGWAVGLLSKSIHASFPC